MHRILLWHIAPEWQLSLELQAQDLWLGARWKLTEERTDFALVRTLNVWLCLVPCLPVHLQLDLSQ
jgi:hypothetical protein